jgi:hypothetical protein
MKFLAGIFVALLVLPALASEKITAMTIDGQFYAQIRDVSIVNGGARIALLYADGGAMIAPDKFPRGFLSSWGITPEALAAAKAAADLKAEQDLAQYIRMGDFREVDGVVYDLRKPQPGWRRFIDAKVLQMIDGGALVDPTPYQPTTTAILVRNFPRSYADHDKASPFMAKSTGDFSYVNKYNYESTIHAYDAGRICGRNEIPVAIIVDGRASAKLPLTARSGGKDRPAQAPPGGAGLRGIGSGFFITKDGYLLTNFHVVREAEKVQVKYKTITYDARVIEKDPEHDLALLKVAGSDFTPLSISHKDSADLGDAVFTIGFPNIEMQGQEPKYTDGKISSLAGMQDDPFEYQISVPVQPGNSGGPLCDANGQVVGIVVARLNDLAALRESGAVPQNVNYAVKAKFALPLLQHVKGLDALLKPAATDAKPVQTVKDATAMILIY